MGLETPILFCIFNRPEVTQLTFESIKRQRPQTLLVSSDGPRENRKMDYELVRQTRQIIEQVDWPCKLLLDYSESNLGCKQRMSSGIDWAFEQVDRLIILEDDCLPHPCFYRYCEELLERYHHCPEVMMISGDNFQSEPQTPYSYYFSKWAHIWGWATWRRAWSLNDVEMKTWPEIRKTIRWEMLVSSETEKQHWQSVFDQQYAGNIDTWDFPWMYACWIHQGLTILPELNLVSNLGFDQNATHTIDPESKLAKIKSHEIGPIKHPETFARQSRADNATWENIFLPSISNASPQEPSPVKPGWLSRFWRKAS